MGTQHSCARTEGRRQSPPAERSLRSAVGGIIPLLRSGVFGAEWEGLGVGGAHQQQECQKLVFSGNCCFQVTLHKAVLNN